MKDRFLARSPSALIIVVSLFISIVSVLFEGLIKAADSEAQDLAQMARNEKGRPKAANPEDVQAAKNRLRQTTSRLNGYLTRGGKNGTAWKRYLHFDQVLAALQPGAATADEALQTVLKRFRANYIGLELPVFQDVATALERYLQVAHEHERPAEPAEIDEKLDQLAARLAKLTDPPAPDDLSEIGGILAWLADHGQSANLVAQVRARLSQPNLQVHISEGMISSGSLRQIEDQRLPVRDVILGTSIFGTGRTTGWARTRLIADTSRAQFETSVVATNRAETVGYNGPARIGSASTTQLSGTKRFYLDGTGFHVWKALSHADARTQIRGIWSNKHGVMDRLVKRVASKRVGQQKRAAERIASRHAETQLNARIDGEANAQLGRAHADFMTKFRNPLLRVGQWPRDLRISTTDEQFRLVALHDSPARLAAPIVPPALPDNVAMAVQFHESLVNNYGDGLLAGQTMRQQQLDQLSLDLFGRRPPQLARDEEKGPWSITFGSREPIVLRVDGGKASLTVRGRRFASEVRTIDTPLDVTAHYRLLLEGNAAKAVREGELEVYPTGFVPDAGRKMSLRQSRDANFVRHRFDDFFTPEITSQGLILPGQWRRVGRLDLVELNADHGWVTLAWRMRDEGLEMKDERMASTAAHSIARP